MNRLGLNYQRKIVQTIEMSHHNRQHFTIEILVIYASLIAQLQSNSINGTNKLSFLSVQNSFLDEHLPRDLKHLTVASPCLILMIWK